MDKCSDREDTDMQIIRIDNENIKAFSELIPEEIQVMLADGGAYVGLGTVEDDYACGQMIAEIEGQTVRIHSIYIAPEYRRRGFATELLIEMAESICEWESVYGYQIEFAESLEEENGLKPFLEYCGFELEPKEDTGTWSCQLGAIEPVWENKNLQMLVIPYEQINNELLQQLRREQPAILAQDIDAGRIEKDCSCVLANKNRLTGCLMVVREDEQLILEWVRITPTNSVQLLGMFQYAVEHAIEKYGPEQTLVVPVLNEKADALLKRMLRNAVEPMEHCWTGTYVFDGEEEPA